MSARQDEFQSCGSTFHLCVWLFPWGLSSGLRPGRGTSWKCYTWQKLGLKAQKGSSCVVGLCSREITLWHQWVRGQLKTPVSHEEQTGRYWDCRQEARRETEWHDPAQDDNDEDVHSSSSSKMSRKYAPIWDWGLNPHVPTSLFAAHQCQCWDWISACIPRHKQFSV